MQPQRPSPFNQPTDMLPPVQEEYQREPELMTHREHDLPPGDRGYIEPDEYLADEDEERRLRKKRIWRRVRRTCYGLAAVGFVGPIIAFIITYFMVTPPDPQTVVAAQGQTMTIYYADKSVMASLGPDGGGNRTIITIDKIPKVVQHAVEAAEDETFETNSGFDLKGIARAALSQVSGGGGGGSGITQQYIKTATGNNQHTLTRKWTELVQAIKMNQVQSKDQILTAYLNTVYFGRGAYGIQAASQAYFKKDVSDLNPSEAAWLAGCINVPALNEDPQHTNDRWTYTMGRMVANGWITQQERDQYPTQPKPKENTSDSDGGNIPGPQVFIVRQVLAEAAQQNGGNYDRDKLQQAGAKIYTSIDPKAQQQAEQASQHVMSADVTPSQPNIANALVSINPSTGEIVAWYGGPDPQKWQFDMASTANQPGSSFKPLVLMAGMQNNSQIGLNSLYDGTSGQKIAGFPVNNSDGEKCPSEPCSVKEAMTLSINTVFYKMTDDIGAANVQKAAFDAGISKTQVVAGKQISALQPPNGDPVQDGIGIGQYEVRPRDMAQAYATLANNGMYIPSHFINSIVDSNGTSLYNVSSDPAMIAKQAFDPNNSTHNAQLARNVTESMLDVAKSSCADYAKTICANLQNNRPVASKTGTAQFGNTGHNANAWMVGYTPQVVTAVWVGNRNAPGPIYGYYLNHIGPKQGYDIYGREEPAYIWQMYMNGYLNGKPVQQFTPFKDLGGNGNFSGITPTTAPPTTTTDQQTTTNNNTTTSTTDPTSTPKKTKPTYPSDPCFGGLCPPGATNPDGGGTGGGFSQPQGGQ
jgi:membrane peptidoglycan carboxypeptidase